MDDFKKPDEATIQRMTVSSITALLETLEAQRTAAVAPLDEEIEFYEKIRDRKKREANAAS